MSSKSLKSRNERRTQVDRLIALIEACPHVLQARRNGVTWEKITKDRTLNPLRLSYRQIQNVYGAEGEREFDKLRRASKKWH